MILDAQNYFSGTVTAATGILAGQALTGTSAVASENTVNTITINHTAGEPLELWLLVSAVGGTCTAFSVALQSHDDASFGATTVIGTWAVGATTAGIIRLGIAASLIPAGEKYLRLSYTMTGTSPTKTIFAGIAPYVQSA